MKKEVTLFSNDYNYSELYREYLDYCEDNGIEPQEDGSREYWDWVSEMERIYWEDLMDNLKYSKYSNNPVVVCGRLGLWNGSPEIEPKRFDNIIDAIMACCSNCDYITIKQYYSTIQVSASHHDGTNNFDIHFLNDKGLFTEKGDLSNRRYHLTIKEYLF